MSARGEALTFAVPLEFADGTVYGHFLWSICQLSDAYFFLSISLQFYGHEQKTANYVKRKDA